MRWVCEYPAPAELLEVDVELDMELVASGLAVLCRSAYLLFTSETMKLRTSLGKALSPRRETSWLQVGGKRVKISCPSMVKCVVDFMGINSFLFHERSSSHSENSYEEREISFLSLAKARRLIWLIFCLLVEKCLAISVEEYPQ